MHISWKWILVSALCTQLFFSMPKLASSSQNEDQFCIYCGMKRSQFGHSWVIITHPNGSEEMMCSIHCAAIGMALHTDRAVSRITVGDYDSREQIDAESAFWVIGGDKLGVMTARGKWAFKAEESAKRFISAHGGALADFKTVLKAAFEDMYQDTLMIRQKRQMMKLRNDAIREK